MRKGEIEIREDRNKGGRKILRLRAYKYDSEGYFIVKQVYNNPQVHKEEGEGTSKVNPPE
jgi:hypothetical protein